VLVTKYKEQVKWCLGVFILSSGPIKQQPGSFNETSNYTDLRCEWWTNHAFVL